MHPFPDQLKVLHCSVDFRRSHNFIFFYSLKTSEKLWLSNVFRVVEKETSGMKWVTIMITRLLLNTLTNHDGLSIGFTKDVRKVRAVLVSHF